jgi:hypothetical protein
MIDVRRLALAMTDTKESILDLMPPSGCLANVHFLGARIYRHGVVASPARSSRSSTALSSSGCG